jgi:hypothetical protein
MSNQRFADIKAFLNHAQTLGALEAKGTLQRGEFFKSFIVAVKEGHLNATQADCTKAWAAFAESKKREDVSKAGLEDTDSAKARVSDLKSAAEATLMGNPDFIGVIERALPIMQALKASKTKLVGNTWDCYSALSRRQREKEASSLTDDEIRNGVQPKDKAKSAYTEENEFKKLIKQLHVLHDGTNATETSPGKEAFPSAELKQMIAIAEAKHARLVQCRVTAEANNKLAAASQLIPANRVTLKVA